jgi:YD repeat-containing protein
MTEIVDPLIETPTDKTQLFAYDEAGNLIQATDRKGLVMQYTYDILNRNTQTLHLFDNSTESTIYDSFGDLIQSQNSAIGYTYTYTSKHQLKSKTDSRLNKSLTWSWDPVGNIQTKPTIKAISPPTNTTVPTVWWPNPTRLIWKSVIITMVQDAWRIAFSATAPIPVMFGTLADV